MWEQLKAFMVLFCFMLLVFVTGVLVGLKLPETEIWQQWRGTRQARQEAPRAVDVAVIQFPGHDDNNCSGGVCKVFPMAQPPAAEPARPEPSEKEVKLTFYHELADHPGPGVVEARGSSPSRKEKTPLKKAKKTLGDKKSTAETAGLWEVRVCSLSQEIKARLERSRLLKHYPSVEIEAVQVAGKGTWYRVKIGPIKDRKVAERYQRELKETGKYKPLIIRKN
jgi:cell division septation protein DedD